MRIALVGDTFPPLRTSGAVQLRDLARAFVEQGHELTVILPAPEQQAPWLLEVADGFSVLRLRAPRTKDLGYLRRTAAESLMPFAMLRNLRRSPLAGTSWDGVVWYAPSIFFGPLVHMLKRAAGCSGYLIIRDIFPEWAVDMGLMGRGAPFWFFKAVAAYQYFVADTIGVQTPGNLGYFSSWARPPHRRLEVLHNWLADCPNRGCSIDLGTTALAGRKILVYAGNMGVAQGVGILVEVAELLRDRTDLGFLFVGRGSELPKLQSRANALGLNNVLFRGEIEPEEVPGLLSQCHVGMLALDPRHRTHNIPGKFLTYMQGGLPVLASVNPGNDLVDLISSRNVGSVSVRNSAGELASLAEQLVARIASGNWRGRCRALFAEMFSPSAAVSQIVAALTQAAQRAPRTGVKEFPSRDF